MNEVHIPNWSIKPLSNRRPAVQLMFGEGTKPTLSCSLISKPEEET